jgi:hypothetical protein
LSRQPVGRTGVRFTMKAAKVVVISLGSLLALVVIAGA